MFGLKENEMDFVNGNKFAELANVVIDFDHQRIWFDRTKDAIVFCKTEYVSDLFKYLQNSTASFVLITHMSDMSITEGFYLTKPYCIKKWFAENVLFNHPDLIPIPLGIENHIGSAKGKHTDHDWLVANAGRLKRAFKDFKLYCNWCSYFDRISRTNHARVPRFLAIKQLNKSGLRIVNHIFQQHLDPGLSFQDYCEEMTQHHFVICPRGYGMDTHRLWEALYLGCIPITLSNRIFDYGLPILQIDSWDDLTEELLIKTVLKERDYTKLHMTYWRNEIQKTFKEINQCKYSEHATI